MPDGARQWHEFEVDLDRMRQGDTIAGGWEGDGRLRRLVRRVAEPPLFVGLVAAALVAIPLSGGHSSPDEAARAAPTSVPIAADRAASSRARLIVPDVMGAGELITVVGFEHRDGCGPVSLVLDGQTVVHAEAGRTAVEGPTWRQVFLTFVVPDLVPGQHQMRLLGPVPGGARGGYLCGDATQQIKQFDSTMITIS
jgi:hypothetical protein